MQRHHIVYADMSEEIESFFHNHFDGSYLVFLKDGRCAHLVFRRLWDSDSDSALRSREVTDAASTSSATFDVPIGVSYDLFYDQVLEIYAAFVAPHDSVRGAPFLRQLSEYFDIAFLGDPGTWIMQTRSLNVRSC